MDITIREVAEILETENNFLLITHAGPDGDAIGSVTGLLCALREAGKNADAYFHEEIPKGYLPIIPSSLTDYLTGDMPDFGSYDIILCLDFSSKERFGEIDLSRYNSLNIDHHPDNTRFAVRNFVRPDAAATAMIIFEILQISEQLRISQTTATLLMTGLIMDTGGFRFQNTSSAALHTAGELMDAGAAYSKIINAMFFSKSAEFAKMEAEIICYHLKTGCGGRFAWFYLSDELLDSFGIAEKDTEGVIDVIRSIKDFDIVAVIKKKENGFRISLRSKNVKYSVGKVARILNGGGHELAAGGFIPTDSLKEAEAILTEEISRIL